MLIGAPNSLDAVGSMELEYIRHYLHQFVNGITSVRSDMDRRVRDILRDARLKDVGGCLEPDSVFRMEARPLLIIARRVLEDIDKELKERALADSGR